MLALIFYVTALAAAARSGWIGRCVKSLLWTLLAIGVGFAADFVPWRFEPTSLPIVGALAWLHGASCVAVLPIGVWVVAITQGHPLRFLLTKSVPTRRL